MDFIALFQKQLGKVGAVLAGDAGNESAFHRVMIRRKYRRRMNITSFIAPFVQI